MPIVKTYEEPTPDRRATVCRAVGTADDFYALGYCPDLDELEKETDPDHPGFTYVLHYVQTQKTVVARIKARIDGLWQPPQGPVLAAGQPEGIVEIDASGAREVALSPPPRDLFRSIWGVTDADVFACGGYLEPVAFYRRAGQWMELPLPADASLPYDVRGLSAREVYFAGEHGEILLWDGQTVSRLAVPTTRYLTSLARLGGTDVMCAAGYGIFLAGNQRGWRIVPTNTTEPLLALAEYDGKVWYGTPEGVWSFDGQSAPILAIQTPASWVSGLADGIVLSDGASAKLYRGGTLVDLDTTV